jgi:hypothetical protein
VLNGVLVGSFVWMTTNLGYAQDLVPRAYLITPVGSNAVTLSSSFFDGPIFTDPTIPITDFKGRFALTTLSYVRSFNFFGRSANVVGTLPYVVGNFHGIVLDAPRSAYRSGFSDARIRASVNLLGGRAMNLDQFVKWREKFVIGASLTISVPIGQYDPAVLLNPGLNRWAVKPELGLSRRWGHWALDLYGGVWVFTSNNLFYPGTRTRSQALVGAGEMHLNYTLKPRFWISADGNFWTGGRSTIDGAPGRDYQRNSRVGGTVSIPLNRNHSVKFSYSKGAYISIGGNYDNFSAAWQYSWVSRPK